MTTLQNTARRKKTVCAQQQKIFYAAPSSVEMYRLCFRVTTNTNSDSPARPAAKAAHESLNRNRDFLFLFCSVYRQNEATSRPSNRLATDAKQTAHTHTHTHNRNQCNCCGRKSLYRDRHVQAQIRHEAIAFFHLCPGHAQATQQHQHSCMHFQFFFILTADFAPAPARHDADDWSRLSMPHTFTCAPAVSGKF